MLINGIELSKLGVQLFDRVLYSNSIDTAQEWLDGDIQPTFIRQQDRFKTIELQFLVLSADEEEAFRRISRLTAMLKKATVKFDDLGLMFDVSITNVGEPTRLKNGNFVVPYTLSSGYAKGEREIYTTNANMTNSFKLTVAYYKNSTTLLSSETVVIRASAFDKENLGLGDLGIDVNKHQPEYHNAGVATNLNGLDLTYENLQSLKVLIINYVPISYNLAVSYYLDDGRGFYNEILQQEISFTQASLSNFQTIGQLVQVNNFRPEGYKGRVAYNGSLELNELLANAPISVFYDKIEVELSKNIFVAYKAENDDGGFDTIQSVIINVGESQFYDGLTLKDIISIDAYHPNPSYYNKGYIDGFASNTLITYNDMETAYSVIYTKAVNTIYVEYYAGTYPDWYRLSTATLQTKHLDKYDNEFNVLTDLNLDLNKYHTAPYNNGALYNQDIYQTYDDVLNAGVLQVYYTAIDYPITVNYYTGDLTAIPISETVNINALMFFGNPILSDIIPILAHRPEGYQFNQNLSYDGEVSLEALTQASPIMIIYEEIEEMRSKNIIVRYKQELASTYSTITTNLITVNEADIIGGTRLKDIISLDAYRPEYYDSGIIDGASSTAITNFDALGSSYDVLYVAKSYTTPVRYYIDEIDDLHWIGSASIAYRVIDFEATTTLFDFGLNLNAYKPSYAGDGVLQYTGPVNFTSLLETPAINVLYLTETTPPDEDGIDYPHRFLFLQHNDLGSYEYLHPEWTMNHAFINTGVSAEDMSRLTVVMECARVDENVPMYQVNAGYAYLFGSTGSQGSFFMRYNNQTMYGENLTGVDTYEAKAGNYSNTLVLTAESAVGFSENTGIYSSPQEGYSRATFTYSNLLATDGAPMTYPLYLFANNNFGSYSNGIAGVGIYSCRIYYNDQLVRDFIPVQYYDKIGDLVAPSNCLYDKITKTFFEDGTKQDSFNIRDDDRYEDSNLQHKIGHCYVNYYKGTDQLKTTAIYFRGDEFDEGEFDLYERFAVDENQPQYTFSGEIENIENIKVSFDGLNNKVFKVIYEPIETQIVVNYYKIEDDGIKISLASDTIALTEKDFYQVPTFGDLVRLNKYKPDGYETNFKYTGSKVSLARVVEGSPYNIEYTKMTEDKIPYSTTIKYIKKVYGVREYETIATKTLTFDQSDFRDGEYIDFYIDKNLMKPERFYKDGTTYQWYEMDERLDSPEDLKASYTIMYAPEPQTLAVNYYTDDVDEDNLVASTSFEIQIDDLDPRLTYSVIEILPNNYINKFKPMGCNGGMVQGGDIAHTFESLVELGHIDIMYETIVEPSDPTEAYYEHKILCFGVFSEGIPAPPGPTKSETLYNGGIIPYIDLGYRPKEMGRLRAEIKAVAQSNGFLANTCSFGWQDTAYVDFFGYRVPRDHRTLGDVNGDYAGVDFGTEDDLGNFYSVYINNRTKGHFSFSTRLAQASNWTYSSEGPQSLDGQLWFAGESGPGVIIGSPKWKYYGTDATFRRGLASIYDENWNVIECYKEYGKTEQREILPWVVNTERWTPALPALANPITTVLDAYNGYWSSYSEEDSNHAPFEVFDITDKDIFEARLQPKGSLSLFRTTNPLTGEVNIMAHAVDTRLFTGGTGTPLGLKGGNPYTGGYQSIEIEVLVRDLANQGTNQDGTEVKPQWVTKKLTKTINYAHFPVPVYPQLEACAVWHVKVWDRDRLVRDLIPVEKGDKVYDYIMPETGMFDLVTEIFFGNANEGGVYEIETYFTDPNANGPDDPQLKKDKKIKEIKPSEVLPFYTILDPAIYGKITMNYYDYDYTFLGNKYVSVPTWFSPSITTFEEITSYNDMKPNEYYLDGFLDIDLSGNATSLSLQELYELGSANIYYKLRTFTKTVIYYQGNHRVGSKDIFYSLQDIENALTIDDLGIDVDLYWTEDFAHGRIMFDESIIASSNIQDFIDAPSPIVVYDKLSQEEAPDLFYVEYYRGGASDDTLITLDPDNPNYLDCDLDGVVLNPNGAIKYYNHYHSALYEDEKFDYFVPYQVKVINKYIGIHRGPAKKFPALATIVEQPILTIIEERNGWGRLKEYPVGWIMLSATEPITGPGQNPDYDAPDSADVATLPFGSEVHITKLTIDRLWCYVPEVESWIKAEDVSYNQSGKLYNALDIDVIHLDTLDFSTITSLDDMGIYPQKKLLYFHNRSDYVYEGEYTYDAFSTLHELEFIYPETIYNYSCIYYKDNMSDGGTEIIAGKGQTTTNVNLRAEPDGNVKKVVVEGETVDLTGFKVVDTDGDEWYPVKYDTYTGYILAKYISVITEPAGRDFGSNELGRASFTCSLGDWNPDWDVFIDTSWRVDENGKEIQPDLYRDTELTLTWDYFGFERNLFKPEGYFDGIYMWNPRSWDRGDIHFTFQELIRVGTQYVLYPTVPMNMYKLFNKKNAVSLTGVEKFQLNNISYPEGTTPNDFYDINIVFDPYTATTYKIGGQTSFSTSAGATPKAYVNGMVYGDKGMSGEITGEMTEWSITYSSGNHHTSYGWSTVSTASAQSNLKYNEPGDYFTLNVSNKRKNNSFVFGHGNYLTGLNDQFYLTDGTKLENNTNLKDNYAFNKFDEAYATNGGGSGMVSGGAEYQHISIMNADIAPITIPANSKASAMSVAVYENFLLSHYWVAVPKGHWYRWNEADYRIQENGWFDLITGKFVASPDGVVYLNKQINGVDIGYDYFDNWYYNTSEIDYIVQVSADTATYEEPDSYAINIRSLAPGLVFPVSKLTSDTDNRVVGEWYFSCDQWLQSAKAPIHAGTFDRTKLTKLQQSFCLVEPANTSEKYYVYLDPSAVLEVGEASNAVYGSGYEDTAFYNYVDTNGNKFFFDGAYWVPEKYTSFNTTEWNKNYAIVPDDLPIYSLPLNDNNYIISNYHYGERITVPYVATQNHEWGYTGVGWIKLNSGTVSEIL